MAKTSGLGDNLYIGTVDISGDVGSLSRIGGGSTLLDVTAINQYAFNRLGGVRDGGIDFISYNNKTGSHVPLSALPKTDVLVSYFRGTAIGNTAASLVAKEIDYAGTRNADGSVTFTTSTASNGYGLDWGNQLTTGKQTFTGASTANILDFGSGIGTTAFGLQAYLHVFAFTGTSATIKLQHSNDNGAGDAYADVTGGAFASVTTATSERIATGRTLSVKRWIRLSIAGTFTNLQCAVVVSKNPASVIY
jgi:hypothetical protein